MSTLVTNNIIYYCVLTLPIHKTNITVTSHTPITATTTTYTTIHPIYTLHIVKCLLGTAFMK